jgi:hypothetical protein
MHLLWRRYARSGYAPPAFYVVMALAFIALAAFAVVRGEWLIAAIAVVMIAVTAAGSRVMRGASDAAEASRRALGPKEDDDG